jgi:hypothetical protein
MAKATKARKAPKNGNGQHANTRGRPSMFSGKNLTRHRSTYMTDEGWEITERLRQYHADKVGFVPSDGDIFEDAIRARARDVFSDRRQRYAAKQKDANT